MGTPKAMKWRFLELALIHSPLAGLFSLAAWRTRIKSRSRDAC